MNCVLSFKISHFFGSGSKTVPMKCDLFLKIKKLVYKISSKNYQSSYESESIGWNSEIENPYEHTHNIKLYFKKVRVAATRQVCSTLAAAAPRAKLNFRLYAQPQECVFPRKCV